MTTIINALENNFSSQPNSASALYPYEYSSYCNTPRIVSATEWPPGL